MIIANLYGGLGNQLFQYSAAYALSKKLNHELKFTNYLNQFYKEEHTKFDLYTLYDLHGENISISELNEIIGKFSLNFNFLRLNQKLSIKLPGIINDKRVSLPKKNKNYMLNGYFQNYEFFSEYQRDLFTIFRQPKKTFALNNDLILSDIKSSNSVSIHIRGNDYLKNKNRQVCNFDYYHNAIKFIQKLEDNPVFFIFTDDISHSQNLLKKINVNFRIISNNYDNSINLYLMSSCNHNIIANSSFSWWAANLNININKKIISPKIWLLNKKINLSMNNWFQI